MEPYEAFEAAIKSTRGVIANVSADQYSSPTPCSEWNVRQLLNHVLGTCALGTGLFRDAPPEVPMVPGGLPDVDMVGADMLAAYDCGADKLLTAVRAPGALERPHQTPLGEMPAAGLAGFTTLDILVHGWDLARATSQKTALPQDIAEHVLGFARMALPPDNRPPSVGTPIAISESAPATDQLVAFLGRRP